jgi:aspartate aminotransferase
MYSNPPVHGARIVANVVGDPALFNEWKAEMEMMAGRIKNVRQKLFDSLSAKDKSGKDWSFILKQIGMFSFTGLNKAQVIVPQIFIKFWISCASFGRIIKKTFIIFMFFYISSYFIVTGEFVLSHFSPMNLRLLHLSSLNRWLS